MKTITSDILESNGTVARKVWRGVSVEEDFLQDGWDDVIDTWKSLDDYNESVGDPSMSIDMLYVDADDHPTCNRYPLIPPWPRPRRGCRR